MGGGSAIAIIEGDQQKSRAGRNCNPNGVRTHLQFGLSNLAFTVHFSSLP